MKARASGHAWLGPLALVLCLLEAQPSRAAELAISEGPGFALVRDARAMAQGACAPGEIGQLSLRDTVQRIQRELALDAELVVVLASAPPSCADLFYVPVANDVLGIGYRHEREDELFDDSPDSALEGIAFLNDWPYWETRPDELARAFKHELGHRWGARVRASIDGEESSELLGRQLKHWSFFMDSGASPLEGNAWQTSDGESFQSQTELASGEFSMLDLYLMGAADPAEVEPSLLLRHVDPGTLAEKRDCRDAPLAASSPPARCESITLDAEPGQVAIEDIIAVEGERVPGAVDRRLLDVAIFVLESERMPLALESCEALQSAMSSNLADFERATRGRLGLRNLTGFQTRCESVIPPPTLNELRGCVLAPGSTSTRGGALLTLLLAWLSAWRARRAPVARSRGAPRTDVRAVPASSLALEATLCTLEDPLNERRLSRSSRRHRGIIR
jgi:hypothetical protein